MGNYYYIYLEANVNGKWRCIDGYNYKKPYGKNEEKLCLMSLYENGSRSYFGETYKKLYSIGKIELFDNLSPEIQEEHPEMKYKYDGYGEKTDEIESYLVVPLNTFKWYVPKNMEHHGVINKDIISAYENGEIEEPFEDEEIDFNKLSPIELQCYQYYEWDSVMGWYRFFKLINELVDSEISKYYGFTFRDNLDFRLVVFCL